LIRPTGPFGISALPVFFEITLDSGGPIRYCLWVVRLLLIWVSRAWIRRVERSGAAQASGR